MSVPGVALKAIEGAGAAGEVLKVQQTGWTPGTYALYAILALLVPCAIALMRYLPTMKKLKDSADGSLRADLMKRIAEVETAAAAARIHYDKELADERADCERRITSMQAKMDAVTRQFVQFQLVIAGAIPPDKAPAAQAAAQRLLEVISTDLAHFEPRRSELDLDRAQERA